MAVPALTSSCSATLSLASPPSRALLSSLHTQCGFHSSASSPFLRDGLERIASRSSCRWASSQTARRRSCPPGGAKALFGLGVPELVVIAGVAALIFGPKKLPEIGKSLGKTVKSFQQAAKEFESEVKQGGESSVEDSSKTEVPAASTVADKDTS